MPGNDVLAYLDLITRKAQRAMDLLRRMTLEDFLNNENAIETALVCNHLGWLTTWAILLNSCQNRAQFLPNALSDAPLTCENVISRQPPNSLGSETPICWTGAEKAARLLGRHRGECGSSATNKFRPIPGIH